MQCPKCGKESNNVRVCGFCHTPFPVDASGEVVTPRTTRAVATPRTTKSAAARQAPADPRVGSARRSRVIWLGVGGLLAVLAAGYYSYYTAERGPVVPVGVAMPNLIARQMSLGEATALLGRMNGTGQVEERGGALTVRIASAMFPERRDGQLAIAQEYARADEIVAGRRRAISFLDPGGKQFATADPDKGVMLTR